MSTDLSLIRARGLWEELASAPVSFPPPGGVSVVVSPQSSMCPPGWVGVVSLGGSAIATTPSDRAAAMVRTALAALPVASVADADAVSAVLPVAQLLGPAALGYVSESGFRPASIGLQVIEQLPAAHLDLRALEELAGDEDAREVGLEEITSPTFVIREGDAVVAACGYQVWPSRTAHMCVLTAPGWRGRGLARSVGSAAVSHALAAGLLPQWRARIQESRRVALALGFSELGTQLSFRLE